jgi:archaellum biogenesis ATPase FlaH
MPESIHPETIMKFIKEWYAAYANYTKHLLSIEENYGQKSEVFALAKEKWAETESQWTEILDDIVRADSSKEISDAIAHQTLPQCLVYPKLNDILKMFETLKALHDSGKFSDIDGIVGPMDQYEVTMESKKDSESSRFWTNLARKVGLRR